jgi:hypothetical protein
MAANALVSNQWCPVTLTDRNKSVATLEIATGTEEFSREELYAESRCTLSVDFIETGDGRNLQFSLPSTELPNWFVPAVQQIARLVSLPFDWDREGSPCVQTQSIESAINTLYSVMSPYSAPPQWTPTRGGGVQLDWHENGVDLEVEFPSAGGEAYAVFSDRLGVEADWDGSVSLHSESIRGLLSGRLSSQ